LKQGTLIGLMAAAFATTLVALQPGVARVMVETRVTRGAPYSADAVSEFVQVLADGNRIVRRTTTRLMRDSEGRTRRETFASSGAVEQVVITDPTSNGSLILDPQNRTAMRAPGSFTMVAGARGRGSVNTYVAVNPQGGAWTSEKVEMATTADVRVEGQVRAEIAKLNDTLKRVEAARGGNLEQGQTSREDLGQQTIEGVTATGSRNTTIIAAGAVGNESPITIVSEQWYSTELQMLVLTRHHDPRVGETTYRVTNIVRIEPDAALFQLPPEYTLQEPKMVRPKVPELPQ
jgi:hypothetical protein